MLQQLELEASSLFETWLGYGFCVRRTYRDDAEHARVLGDGVTLVAVQHEEDSLHGEDILGFAMVLPLSKAGKNDGTGMHLFELNTRLDVQRQGIGKGLLEAAENWAKENKAAYMTLFTFRDVPWNAPYYETQGYREFSPVLDEFPDLRDIWQEEIEVGWHQAPRIAMRKLL